MPGELLEALGHASLLIGYVLLACYTIYIHDKLRRYEDGSEGIADTDEGSSDESLPHIRGRGAALGEEEKTRTDGNGIEGSAWFRAWYSRWLRGKRYVDGLQGRIESDGIVSRERQAEWQTVSDKWEEPSRICAALLEDPDEKGEDGMPRIEVTLSEKEIEVLREVVRQSNVKIPLTLKAKIGLALSTAKEK